MKLNFSKLNTSSTASNTATGKTISFATSATNNTATTSTADTSTNSKAVTFGTAAGTTASNSFSLSFTNDKTYDLDELVEYKKRNNADCPLIVEVTSDDAVVTIITEKILNDYGVTFSTDSSSDIYYKKMLNTIPSYTYVFTEYFNKYYNEYKAYLSANTAGSVSIDTAAELILNDDSAELQALIASNLATYKSSTINKPQIDWEISDDVASGEKGNDSAYALKPATKTTLGGVIIGNGVNVAEDGTISTDTYTTAQIDKKIDDASISFEKYLDLLQTNILLDSNGTILNDANGNMLVSQGDDTIWQISTN